jgi:hypothetical protein
MRHFLSAALACGLALLLAGSAVAVTPPARASGSLLEAWNNITSFNEDLARIDRARDALESEVARTPSLDALLLLAWAHLLWADYRAPDVDAKLASYERGRDVAKRAIEMAPRSPEAHLWYAANLGRWAVTKGKLQAAFLLSTLRQEIQTVLELDPANVPGRSTSRPRRCSGATSRAPRDTCERRSRSIRTSRAPVSSWPGVSSRKGATMKPDRS